MSDGRRVFSRFDLYQQIWADTVLRTAHRLEVYPDELSRACKAHDIPVPPRGYWTLVTMGKEAAWADLPPHSDLGSEVQFVGKRFWHPNLSEVRTPRKIPIRIQRKRAWKAALPGIKRAVSTIAETALVLRLLNGDRIEQVAAQEKTSIRAIQKRVTKILARSNDPEFRLRVLKTVYPNRHEHRDHSNIQPSPQPARQRLSQIGRLSSQKRVD